ncbi:MAG: tRNA preQ1(34) S-adenosylmethionine ribosyltransferase-isomerase QueA [Tenericutes bacterium]|jgi:S-adenosylmethionine:tRNA ribosyltransferase-isomerase|nr:tRNA preQ1(34) S-adenosylmethionine ribosyltransferase-isomerase QueA [Mycoplasmatota bacterium]
MNTNDFDFILPEYLIAQHPINKRDESRLLVLDKSTGDIKHCQFKEIINFLHPNDVLVLNNTKVIPARIIGIKEETKAVIQLLLLKDQGNNQWECLTKPARRVKVGTIISFGNGKLKAKCLQELDEGIRVFTLIYEGILYEILDELGSMPLPPYIHEKITKKDRYQTVYASTLGSSAAPTAGLHFTKELLDEIDRKGIKICFVTLHIGLGTFRPVTVTDVTKHVMHSEYYEMDTQTANILNAAKSNNYNIISVGTTTTRTLETIINKYDKFKSCSGWTDIFIYPGYKFKAVDQLITNFHLPKSTLLMLVSALSSKEKILNAYDEAIKKNYRFFSFGDSMFIK